MWTNDKIRFWLALFAILMVTLLPCIRFTVALAEEPEPLAFVDTQPAEAFENEVYTWKIIVKGGEPPYSCSLASLLPPGLFLDTATFTVSGKPPKGVTSDRYTFGIKVTDSSNPPLSIEAPFTITVQYRSNIAVSSGLSASGTDVYVDGQQVGRLSGGEKISRIFPSGTKHTITVGTLDTAPGENDARLRPVMEKIVVDGLSPDANFDYFSEYDIRVKSNQPDIPQMPGSGWYKTGDPLSSTAPAQIDPKTGVQYRFSHWLLPTGEVYGNPNLSWKVTKPGEVIAIYDTYYQLIVNSEHCEVAGNGWYKADSKAIWNIRCSDSTPAPGFWGYIGVQLRAEKDTGIVLMDAPKEIEVTWKPDYSRVVIPIVTGIIVASVIGIFSLLHNRIKRVMERRY